MSASTDSTAAPAEFTRALAEFSHVSWRGELEVAEIPAPTRIAPFSSAMTADVVVADEELGSGRLILLHDPAGNDAWEGIFRLVSFARSRVDPEMAADPLIAEVGWSWLTDSLASHGAEYVAPSGTVTAVCSASFGAMADDPPSAEVEIRASWTPVLDHGHGLAAHLDAWAELLCTTAGLPTLPEGVSSLRPGGSNRLHDRS